MSDARPPIDGPNSIARYHTRLDRGARRVGLGGVRVWRLVKQTSQLLVVSFAFWGGITGKLSPTMAFVGMLVAIIGTEGIESVLAEAGGIDVTISSSNDETADDSEDCETDGGVVLENHGDPRERQR